MISIAFIVITIFSLILFYFGTGNDKKVIVWGLFWLLISGSLAFSGYFINTSENPPRFLIIFLGATVLTILLYKIVKVNHHNTKYLLAIHALRFPVELVLYQLFLQQKVPVLMTYKGWNYDILIGISAIILLLYMLFTKKKIPKQFMLVWNILAMFFLVIVVLIALLSSTLPFQQLAFDQPNVAVQYFPFVYLPALVVPIVFLSHILLFKKNQKKKLIPKT